MPQVDTYLESVYRLAYEALCSGKPQDAAGRTSASWDVSGGCLNPSHIALCGREEVDRNRKIRRLPYWVDLTVACRRCHKCLRNRAYQWSERALIEMSLASRTWFGSLTLTPENHQHFLNVARKKASPADLEAMSELEQFQRRHWAISPEITKFMKRVRTNSEAEIRFLLVAEAHKSGLPHYHVLIHEGRIDQPVRHRVLKGAWQLGFSDWKLADGREAAYYVTKYLSKSMLARVRASIDYGKKTIYNRSEPQKGVSVEKPTTPQTTGPLMGDKNDG